MKKHFNILILILCISGCTILHKEQYDWPLGQEKKIVNRVNEIINDYIKKGKNDPYCGKLLSANKLKTVEFTLDGKLMRITYSNGNKKVFKQDLFSRDFEIPIDISFENKKKKDGSMVGYLQNITISKNKIIIKP